jgi:hypothetical protein
MISAHRSEGADQQRDLLLPPEASVRNLAKVEAELRAIAAEDRIHSPQ